MSVAPPDKVLITGGHEVGGLSSFAQALGRGFAAFGIKSEIIRPSELLFRWSDLRNPGVLKVLNTSAILAAPLAKRSICVAHGTTSARDQGWVTCIASLVSYKLANAFRHARLVAISHYVAIHLNNIFNISIDATIRNPVDEMFLEPFDQQASERCYVTFVGRLVRCKGLNRLLPAIRVLLDENDSLRCRIVGDGPERSNLEKIVSGDDRIEFVGPRDHCYVREQLRRTKVFISGAPNEGFGIAYLEALSQGCNVVMPACGGGLEIALQRIGNGIYLIPISLDEKEVIVALRMAAEREPPTVPLDEYSVKSIAAAYLDVDRVMAASMSAR